MEAVTAPPRVRELATAARPRPVVRNLQALRAIAAVAIVVAHMSAPDGFAHKSLSNAPILPGLYATALSGIDLFFLVSGFIMFTTTQRAHGPRDAGRFLVRRITRIYPPYLVVTAAIFVVYLWRPEAVNASERIRPSVFDSFLLLPQSGFPLLPIAWTLTYELYFYLAFALVLLAPRRWFWPAIGAWAVVVAALSQVPGGGPYLHVAANPLAFEFMGGVLIGWLTTRLPKGGGLWITLLGVAAAAPIYVAEWNHPGRIFGDPVLRVLTIGVALALVVYGMVALERRGTWTAPRLLVHLGDSSYSLYLTHVPTLAVFAVVVAHLPGRGIGQHLVLLVVAVLLCIALGEVFHLLVEAPLLRLIHDRLTMPHAERAAATRMVAGHPEAGARRRRRDPR